MDKLVQIKKRLREIVEVTPNLPITATVVAVENDYCTVELKSGLHISDVKLKATIGNDDYLKVIPKVGSTVVVISLTGDKNNLVLLKIDEAEKIEYKQSGLEVLIDSTDGKVSIKNSELSLIDVFSDLAALLKELKVYTPAGPSGTPLPDTIAAITELEAEFNQLLK